METVSVTKKRSLYLLAGLLAFFLGMFLRFGVGVYNDSEQYISMHIHREPLYPLFLAFFRLFAKDGALAAAAVVQNVLTAYSIYALSEYLRKKFGLPVWKELVIVAVQLAPHLMTKYVSALGIFLENSVMSEALCIPLFELYLLFLLRMIYEDSRSAGMVSLLLSLLLSLTRSQMMVTILMWLIVQVVRAVLQKRFRRILWSAVAVVLLFGARSLTTHIYNYGVTGYFMGNTYGKVNTLTNVIYACDPEDGQVLAEGSLERQFFDTFYEQADQIGANYRYGGNSFAERAEHLENCHDALKFEILETNLSAYYFGLGKVDYYQQSSMSDAMAGTMLKALLPVCFGQWLYDYILLCTYGFVRSIAVVHPVINWLALVLYAVAVLLTVWGYRQKRARNAAILMSVALLFIVGNVCAASLTIMCLSRYMIYGFAPFYIALFLLGTAFAKEWRSRLHNKKKEMENRE